MNILEGFSKLSKREKYLALTHKIEGDQHFQTKTFEQFSYQDPQIQKLLEEFSENTLSNFPMPYGLAPNFLINQKLFHVPMVIEESSVVAAAAKAAKFWLTRGGFKAEVLGTVKKGHVHFLYFGDVQKITALFQENRSSLLSSVEALCSNMKQRGGGIQSLELLDKTSELGGLFQLEGRFETCDAMGANFINSILETWAQQWNVLIQHLPKKDLEGFEILMSILTNYSPECRVKASVNCPIDQLGFWGEGKISPQDFARRFYYGIQLAKVNVERATTHNKGIMNGIDAVVLATGNDFRAIEAGAHTWAARHGRYEGLSKCTLDENLFSFELEIPLSVGTVGGLTTLHPLAKASLDLLGRPSAPELMQIMACVGLAQNFSAVSTLVTTGIQKGHMKMHLLNILRSLEASPTETELAKAVFSDKIISYQSVRSFLSSQRGLAQ